MKSKQQRLYPISASRITQTIMAMVVLPLLCTNAFSQSNVLMWKLKKDQQFDVELVQSFQSETKVDSRETMVENKTKVQMAWKVLSVTAAGEATIEQSLSGIKLEVSDPAIPAQAVKYDTSAPEDVVKGYSKGSRTLLKQIRPLIGLKFNVVMASTGEIQEVVLPPETSKVVTELPGAVRLRAMFSPDGIKELMGSAAIVLPETEMKDGDSWSDEKEMKTPFGDFTRKRKYTLVGRKTEDGNELAEFSIEPEAVKLETLSMNGSGKLFFNVEGGYFKSSSIKNSLKTNRMYREKKIETVVTNEVQMTVKKK